MNILRVLTSHDQLGDTGKKTGFRLEEFAAPYYVFKDAGAKVTLMSPKGASRRRTRRATSQTPKPRPLGASAPIPMPSARWPAPAS